MSESVAALPLKITGKQWDLGPRFTEEVDPWHCAWLVLLPIN